MNAITPDKAAMFASICKYWEIRDAETNYTLADKSQGMAFEQTLNSLLENNNLKVLKLHFGESKHDARKVSHHIATTSYTEDDATIFAHRSGSPAQFFLGSASGRPANGGAITAEQVSLMIQTALANQQNEHTKLMLEMQFKFSQQLLDAQTKAANDRLAHERELMEIERKAFEERMNSGQTSIVEKVIDGIIKVVPGAVAALNGIKPKEAEHEEEDDDDDDDEGPAPKSSLKFESQDEE